MTSQASIEQAPGTGTPGREPPLGSARASVLDAIRQDLHYAVRNLSRSPGFVVVTLLSLTFAIAVSTVVFSVVNATLFRPVPHVADPDRLVHVYSQTRTMGRGPSSFPDFLDYREMSGTLEGMAAVGSSSFAVGRVAEGTRQIFGLEVSAGYFQLLGTPLLRGRGFVPDDVIAGGRVVVIGYNTWQRDFDGTPDILGRELYLNGRAHTVVGVGPAGMVAMNTPVLLEIAVPMMSFRDRRGRLSLDVVGRMRDGVEIPQVQAEFDAIASQMIETYPDHWDFEGNDPRGLRIVSSADARIPEGAPLAAIAAGVGGIVGLIMLIACSNVANLLLTRAFRRRTEIAIRSAIGAPAKRVFGQLLLENLLLFGLAGCLGLLLTHGLASVVQSGWVLIPPPGAEISVDGRVSLFTLGVTLATGLTFGLLPALQASRPDLVPALKGLAPVLRFRVLGVRNLLVGAQIGGSLVLVLVTILLMRSVSQVGTLDLGFDPTRIATLSLDLSHREYGEEEGAQFYQNLITRTESLPGIQAVGLASWVPLAGGSTRQGGLEPEGYEAGPEEYILADLAIVTPGYLDLAGMRLLRGRDFGAEDNPASPQVVLVNQSLVDRFWPGQDGLGKRIGTADDRSVEVIGVVADVMYRDLTSEVGPQMWRPLAQAYQPDLVLHARTAGDPRAILASLRRAVSDLDPNLPVIRADLMENISANAITPHRVLSTALGATGFFTLALAMLGIYGVVGYSVSMRTREMGLRMALGAEPRRLLRMVLKEGFVLSLVGLVPGLLMTVVASHFLRAVLIGVSPLDPVAFGVGIALLLLAVMTASLVPGLRAARAHPMQSLRTD